MSESEKSPTNKLFGLNPGELLERALESARKNSAAKAWQPPSPEELSLLLPQYQIEGLIGSGGMGAVYKGRQVSLDRLVAIKILPPELAEDHQFVMRFEREARTLAKLQHPGIVAVYESGQTSEGHLYFVMEYVEGTDLRKILQENRLDSEQALLLICHICNALQAAHKVGIVHRDIKPENILISDEGNVKLADFGLSRPTENEVYDLTMTNMAMGTPDYMSPEQKDGKSDERSDIYALGIVFYEMLTGRPPRGAFDPPSHKVQVDVRLDGIVIKALQELPERRYQHVTEFSEDVDHVRNTPQPSVDVPAKQGVVNAKKTAPRFPVMIGAGLALVALLGGLFVWAPWRHREETNSSMLESDHAGVNTFNPDFKISTNNGQITITKYTGSSDSLQIPKTINGLPVTSIEREAFQRCKTLTSVLIPDSVTNIGNLAFEECSSLSNVTIPAGVTLIGHGAFGNCLNLNSLKISPNNTSYSMSSDGIIFNKDQSSIISYPSGRTNSNYEIPKSVKTIESRAFEYSQNLLSIVIPDSVTSIGADAFTGCKNLSTVIIPDSVSSIARYAFFRCSNLKSIRIPNGLTRIENGFCNGLNKIENVTIPSLVSSIGDSAFDSCPDLTNVSIPASVTNIGFHTFAYCPKLKSVVFEGNAPILGKEVFHNAAPDFKVYYKAGATGFTSPVWTDSSGGRWPSQELSADNTINK